jgi:hypothetical protein
MLGPAQVTKRTRRRITAAATIAANALALAHASQAGRAGELVRVDLVTFGAANLQLLTSWPWLLDRLWGSQPPGWDVAGDRVAPSPGEGL